MTATTTTTMPVVVGLCASRHAMPVNSYIYPEPVSQLARLLLSRPAP